MKRKLCKECGNKIQQVDRTQFCTSKCSYAFHGRKLRENQTYQYKKVFKIKRLCIGAYCRGHKYFMSEGKWNRICQKCKTAPDYKNLAISYKFESAAKR